MPNFNYTAKDSTGNTVSGIIEADSPVVAAGKLREKGLWLLKAEPVGSNKSQRSFAQALIGPFYTGVSVKGRMLFFRQLAATLDAGVPIADALSRQASRATGTMRRILTQAAAYSSQGRLLSEAMAHYPFVFNEIDMAVVRAGESGGFLPRAASQLADCYEREVALRNKIRMLTIYPKLLILALFFIPGIQVLILETPAKYFSMKLDQLWGILVVFLPVYIVCKLALTISPIRFVWDAFKSSIPVIGPLVRKINSARFARAFSAAYSGGLSMSSSLRLAADVYGNTYASKPLKKAVVAVENGRGLVESLQGTKSLPPTVMDMLDTGERTGGLDSALNKAAEYLEGEAETSSHVLSYVFAVAMLIVVLIVGANMVLGGFQNTMGQYANDLNKINK